MLKSILLCSVVLSFYSISLFAKEKEVHHFPGIFIGATSVDGDTNASFGINYEYRFNNEWGAGAVFESTNHAHHGDSVDVALISAYYHPKTNWRMGLGYGREKIRGPNPYSENLIRSSASYDFNIGSISVAPTVAFDFIDGERSTIFGVSFIKSF